MDFNLLEKALKNNCNESPKLHNITFGKGKISFITKVKMDTGFVNIHDLMEETSARFTAEILERTAEERTLEYTFKIPTFFDWLLRRKRKATFELKVKDLLLDPANYKGFETVRTYEVKEK